MSECTDILKHSHWFIDLSQQIIFDEINVLLVFMAAADDGSVMAASLSHAVKAPRWSESYSRVGFRKSWV